MATSANKGHHGPRLSVAPLSIAILLILNFGAAEDVKICSSSVQTAKGGATTSPTGPRSITRRLQAAVSLDAIAVQANGLAQEAIKFWLDHGPDNTYGGFQAVGGPRAMTQDPMAGSGIRGQQAGACYVHDARFAGWLNHT
jgi:hypothetical protein